MHASGGKNVLPCSLLLLYKLRLCLCAELVSAESCGKQSHFYEQGTAGSCGHISHILSYPVRGQGTKEKMEMRDWAVFCLNFEKQAVQSETERENKEKESYHEILFILTVLLPHLGQLFFHCHLSCQWQMTPVRKIQETISRYTFTSGQMCPGPCPSPRTSSLPFFSPVYTVTLTTLFTWFLVSWLHFSRWLFCSLFLVCLCFFSLSLLLWDAVWLSTLACVE